MIKKRPYQLFILFLLSLIPLVTLAQPTQASTTWSAKYWNNRDLSGDPAFTRHEASLFHNWGDGSPSSSINPDNFSARWEGNIHIDHAGTYRFTATMDDGMRMWIDGNQVMDTWYDSQAHTVIIDVYLGTGDHPTRVEYYEAGGGAVAQLSWQPAGPIANWKGEYFNNPDLFGQPILVRDDGAINFDWGTNSPDSSSVPNDQFSVRWTRALQFEPGLYRFTMTIDDGARLWVNNLKVLDDWQVGSLRTVSVDVNLAGGTVPIKMEYFDDKDNATAKLSWTRISGVTGTNLPNPETAVNQLSWPATYYNNMHLTPPSVLQRTDLGPNYNWGSSSPVPNVVSDQPFSVRWSRDIDLGAGEWIFKARVQGGVRVYVNGQLLIDEWGIPNTFVVRDYGAAINVPGGAVPVVVEYFKYKGLAEIDLDWYRPGAETSTETVQVGSAGSISVPTPSGENTAVVTGALYLNVRSGPGMEFEPFTHLAKGDVVEMIGRSGGWVQVRLPNGETGWVGSSFLNTNSSIYDLPVVSSF